jgi:hypothetical protein
MVQEAQSTQAPSKDGVLAGLAGDLWRQVLHFDSQLMADLETTARVEAGPADAEALPDSAVSGTAASAVAADAGTPSREDAAAQHEKALLSSAEASTAISATLAPTPSALVSGPGDAASGDVMHGRMGDTAKEGRLLALVPVSPAPKAPLESMPWPSALRMASIASLVEQRSIESAQAATSGIRSESPVQAAGLEDRQSAQGVGSVQAGVKPSAHSLAAF